MSIEGNLSTYFMDLWSEILLRAANQKEHQEIVVEFMLLQFVLISSKFCQILQTQKWVHKLFILL